jgi:hypothetical protein
VPANGSRICRLSRDRILLIAFFVWPMSPLVAAEVLETATSGATCQRLSKQSLIETRCKGPAGYIAVILNRDRVMRINYGRSDDLRLGREPDGSGLLWRGSNRLIGDRVEWRLVRGKPFAAIVRIFTLAEDDRPLQQFLIAKVTPSATCELARVSVLDSNALGIARDLADSRAAIIECEFEGRQ